MRRALPLIVLLLAPPLAGCAAQTAGMAGRLVGSEWRFVEIDGEKPASKKSRLHFESNGIDASVGCNSISGNWGIDNDRLIAGPLAQTRMFCEGKLGEQENAIAALLVAAPEVTRDGNRLELRSGGHHARLERKGPRW